MLIKYNPSTPRSQVKLIITNNECLNAAFCELTWLRCLNQNHQKPRISLVQTLLKMKADIQNVFYVVKKKHFRNYAIVIVILQIGCGCAKCDYLCCFNQRIKTTKTKNLPGPNLTKMKADIKNMLCVVKKTF